MSTTWPARLEEEEWGKKDDGRVPEIIELESWSNQSFRWHRWILNTKFTEKESWNAW